MKETERDAGGSQSLRQAHSVKVKAVRGSFSSSWPRVRGVLTEDCGTMAVSPPSSVLS